eukprot:6214067-Pleurochrysis_carterae.AAC.2
MTRANPRASAAAIAGSLQYDGCRRLRDICTRCTKLEIGRYAAAVNECVNRGRSGSVTRSRCEVQRMVSQSRPTLDTATSVSQCATDP